MEELLNLMCIHFIKLNKLNSQWTSWSVRQTIGQEDRGSDLVDHWFRTRAFCSYVFSYPCLSEKTVEVAFKRRSRLSSLVLVAPRSRFECSPIVLVGQPNCIYGTIENYKLGLLLPSIWFLCQRSRRFSQWGTTITNRTEGALTPLVSVCRLLRIFDMCKMRHRFAEHFVERLFKSSYNQLLNSHDSETSHS